MVKKLQTKADIRRSLETAIHRYLNDGGMISAVQQGVSGNDVRQDIGQKTLFVRDEKVPRTLLNQAVKEIEQRKSKQKTGHSSQKRPRKKIIYDDFGDPIREIWE
ncbi:MAG: hypothetical protein ACI82Z_000715 [Cellvibrionaceae bacterium]|jgi:hypothetical protein